MSTSPRIHLSIAALAFVGAPLHRDRLTIAPRRDDPPCTATDSSKGSRLVTGNGFTFCLPLKWKLDGEEATRGPSRVRWGVGDALQGAIARTGRVVFKERPALDDQMPNGMESSKKTETVDGRRVEISRSKLQGQYGVIAQWQTPSLFFAGSTTSSSDADAIIAMARSVRFTTP